MMTTQIIMTAQSDLVPGEVVTFIWDGRLEMVDSMMLSNEIDTAAARLGMVKSMIISPEIAKFQ